MQDDPFVNGITKETRFHKVVAAKRHVVRSKLAALSPLVNLPFETIPDTVSRPLRQKLVQHQNTLLHTISKLKQQEIMLDKITSTKVTPQQKKAIASLEDTYKKTVTQNMQNSIKTIISGAKQTAAEQAEIKQLQHTIEKKIFNGMLPPVTPTEKAHDLLIRIEDGNSSLKDQEVVRDLKLIANGNQEVKFPDQKDTAKLMCATTITRVRALNIRDKLSHGMDSLRRMLAEYQNPLDIYMSDVLGAWKRKHQNIYSRLREEYHRIDVVLQHDHDPVPFCENMDLSALAKFAGPRVDAKKCVARLNKHIKSLKNTDSRELDNVTTQYVNEVIKTYESESQRLSALEGPFAEFIYPLPVFSSVQQRIRFARARGAHMSPSTIMAKEWYEKHIQDGNEKAWVAEDANLLKRFVRNYNSDPIAGWKSDKAWLRSHWTTTKPQQLDTLAHLIDGIGCFQDFGYVFNNTNECAFLKDAFAYITLFPDGRLFPVVNMDNVLKEFHRFNPLTRNPVWVESNEIAALQKHLQIVAQIIDARSDNQANIWTTLSSIVKSTQHELTTQVGDKPVMCKKLLMIPIDIARLRAFTVNARHISQDRLFAAYTTQTDMLQVLLQETEENENNARKEHCIAYQKELLRVWMQPLLRIRVGSDDFDEGRLTTADQITSIIAPQTSATVNYSSSSRQQTLDRFDLIIITRGQQLIDAITDDEMKKFIVARDQIALNSTPSQAQLNGLHKIMDLVSSRLSGTRLPFTDTVIPMDRNSIRTIISQLQTTKQKLTSLRVILPSILGEKVVLWFDRVIQALSANDSEFIRNIDLNIITKMEQFHMYVQLTLQDKEVLASILKNIVYNRLEIIDQRLDTLSLYETSTLGLKMKQDQLQGVASKIESGDEFAFIDLPVFLTPDEFANFMTEFPIPSLSTGDIIEKQVSQDSIDAIVAELARQPDEEHKGVEIPLLFHDKAKNKDVILQYLEFARKDSNPIDARTIRWPIDPKAHKTDILAATFVPARSARNILDTWIQTQANTNQIRQHAAWGQSNLEIFTIARLRELTAAWKKLISESGLTETKKELLIRNKYDDTFSGSKRTAIEKAFSDKEAYLIKLTNQDSERVKQWEHWRSLDFIGQVSFEQHLTSYFDAGDDIMIMDDIPNFENTILMIHQKVTGMILRGSPTWKHDTITLVKNQLFDSAKVAAAAVRFYERRVYATFNAQHCYDIRKYIFIDMQIMTLRKTSSCATGDIICEFQSLTPNFEDRAFAKSFLCSATLAPVLSSADLRKRLNLSHRDQELLIVCSMNLKDMQSKFNTFMGGSVKQWSAPQDNNMQMATINVAWDTFVHAWKQVKSCLISSCDQASDVLTGFFDLVKAVAVDIVIDKIIRELTWKSAKRCGWFKDTMISTLNDIDPRIATNSQIAEKLNSFESQPQGKMLRDKLSNIAFATGANDDISDTESDEDFD